MMIVDSQVHIWGADTPDRPWPEGRATQAQKPYPVTADMVVAAMDEAGVDRTILVPPSWEGDRNDLVLDAAKRYPTRLAAMGRLPLDEPNPGAVATWRNQPGMLGMRFTFHAPHMRGVANGWHGRLAVGGGAGSARPGHGLRPRRRPRDGADHSSISRPSLRHRPSRAMGAQG